MINNPQSPPPLSELRRQAEAILRDNEVLSLDRFEALPADEKRRILHELQVNQTVLSLQNERLNRLQSELEDSNSLYFQLYDLAPVGYCTLSQEGFVLHANLSAAGLLGTPRQELAAKKLAEFVLPEDRDAYTQFESTRIAKGAQRWCELRLVRDGTPFWARLESTVAQDIKGAPVLHVVISDITDRKRAEDELREKEQRLHFLLTSTPAVIYTARASGDFGATFVSENVLEQMGYSACEFIEDSAFWVKHIHPDDVERVFAEMLAHLPYDSHEHEYRFLHKDGAYRWMHDQVKLVRDAAGQPALTIGCWIDITARREAEEALRASETKLRDLIHASPVPMALNDDHQNITFLNRSFVDTFGYTQEEIPTLAEWWPRAYPDPEYRSSVSREWQAEIERAAQTGTPFAPMEVSIRCKNGAYRTALASAASFSNSQDRNHLVVLYDITERKMAQEEQFRLQARLQQSQKMESVGLLAGGVAHDFNNMLGVILGHTEMALDELSVGDALYEHLTAIQTAAERSASLTGQLLAFARKQTIAPQTLDLNQTVTNILPMLTRLVGEGIRVVWEPQANPSLVKMDPSQVDQILTNLCINARHAMIDIGQVAIETGNVLFDLQTCAAHPGLEPGEHVRLTVRDNGCGMDEETLQHIFEPFFTTRGMGAGVGLGLATVYGAVTQNNGIITAASHPGQGTVFDIFLPLYHGVPTPSPVETAVDAGERGHETILIVEDEPAILHIVRTALGAQGYTVMAASSSDEALRIAREHSGPIHLLLTDVVIPEMRVTDLVEALSALYPNLKRLFMSGYTADVIARHGVLDEGLHFIQKPFSMVNLVAKVRGVLNADIAVGPQETVH